MLPVEKTKLGEDQIILPETYSKQQAQRTIVLGKLVVPKLASYKNILHSLDNREPTIFEEVHV